MTSVEANRVDSEHRGRRLLGPWRGSKQSDLGSGLHLVWESRRIWEMSGGFVLFNYFILFSFINLYACLINN